MFEALRIQMKFQYLIDRFEYCLTKSHCPKLKLKLKTCSTYFGDGVAQSQADTAVFTSDSSPSPHQVAPPLQSDLEECANTSVQLSHPPTPPTCDMCVYLACKPTHCHMDLFP